MFMMIGILQIPISSFNCISGTILFSSDRIEYFYLYINDTLNSYVIDPNPFTILYGGFFDGPLSLGAEQNPLISQGGTSYPDWTSFFNGKTDDVRIYDRVLNGQEIHTLYTIAKEVDPF